jgi:hypothetical protein
MSLILDGTNGLSDVDGSAATPAIRGTDANTGIFFPAADTIGFAEGGTEVARFDSSGNLGIGTNTPAGSMQLLRSSDPQFIITDDLTSSFSFGTTTGYSAIGTDAAAISIKTGVTTGSLYNTGTERMRIDSSGRVTTPFQPAFICKSNAGTATYTSGQKVGFNNTPDLNVGSNYSAANSRFTAPVAGLYMFKAQVWSFASNPSATRFHVNGTAKYGSYGNEATQIGFNGYVLVELFYLNANDYVEVFCRISTSYADSDFSTFSGFLVG